MGLFSKLLSVGADKEVNRYRKMVAKINDLEPTYKAMSDDELRGMTAKLRERYDDGNGESLDDLLFDAFATMREASRRVLGMRHFDVQMMGAIALHEGQIAEMKTGEGKTLVSTLAGYLNAIAGKGVHVVTVNDYLAKRDSEWMGRPYKFLGMRVGLIQNGMPLDRKRPAYAADVTYGTNSEFGFDYLRDNMVLRAEDRVQRGHAYAIVDEVDSILIDEARTPLIISGAGTKSAGTYKDFARAVRGLTRGYVDENDLLADRSVEPDGDYVMDEAKHTISATEAGLEKIEKRLGLDIYSDYSGALVNHLQQALKAEYLFHRNKQYIVTNGEVKIVDEFTGRVMEGRRYSEGLHQAIEAKEGVTVREENQTLATITLQNYFRLYDKLSGMTGTALTEDSEFREIYKLPVQVIPPHKPSRRVDREDLVYRTVDAKFNAVADDIADRHAKGQPVLVGTVSIESSERLSALLDQRGIDHAVLNAKHHEREAHIVAQAGRLGAVTIATNMAGRGTDILLGGNPDELANQLLAERGWDAAQTADPEFLAGLSDAERARLDADQRACQEEAERTCKAEHDKIVALGQNASGKEVEPYYSGLCVIGTERHESRRIDNQLRGRSGRQGDPGVTRFYLSLEDDLMRLFGGDNMDKISAMMTKWGMADDEPIEHRMVTKAVEKAQRKVEGINFGMRKNVLEYDDVMNKQRKVIYGERNKVLDGKDLSGHIQSVIADTVSRAVAEHVPADSKHAERDYAGLASWAAELTGKPVPEELAELGAEQKRREVAEAQKPEKEQESDRKEARRRQKGHAAEGPTAEHIDELVLDYVKGAYDQKEAKVGEDVMRELNTQVMLRVIDTRWMTYLQEMDYLKQGIGLRGFGQRDPLVEYKSEAFKAFHLLVDTMYEDYLRTVLRVELRRAPEPTQAPQAEALENAQYSGPADVDGDAGAATIRREAANAAKASTSDGVNAKRRGKVTTYRKDLTNKFMTAGRNDPCPCGSGKKYKNCCWDKYH